MKQPQQLPSVAGIEVLARRGSAPVWGSDSLAGRTVYFAASAPDELRPNEPLRERLRPGRFEGLIPLVQFLRRVTAEHAWDPPPLRAMMMFDDPNLRWPSYGHIDYQELSAHARHHGYHAAMAMIPLDGWIAHPTAARLFRDHPDRLSLLMHGLKHKHFELTEPLEPAARERAVARALRSVEAFERRTRVAVSRVMVAPHGRASEQYLATLLRFGIEALFADVPFPWPGGAPPPGVNLSWWHPRLHALAGWHPVSFVAGGMPVIPRLPFVGNTDAIVLAAFLDSPLALYGHHEDVEDGLEALDRAAALVDSLGPVQWASASAIARQNVLTRVAGSKLSVRLLARRVEVKAPAQVKMVEVDLSLVDGDLEHHQLLITRPGGETTAVPAERTVTIEASAGRLSIELQSIPQLNHRNVAAARPALWPVLRRAMTESRDRIRPLRRR